MRFLRVGDAVIQPLERSARNLLILNGVIDGTCGLRPFAGERGRRDKIAGSDFGQPQAGREAADHKDVVGNNGAERAKCGPRQGMRPGREVPRISQDAPQTRGSAQEKRPTGNGWPLSIGGGVEPCAKPM